MLRPFQNRQVRPHPWVWPLCEFAVVFGLCMMTLFVIIPAGTADSDNFGLSPRMVPIFTISFIAVVSVFTLFFGLFRTGRAAQAQPKATGGLRGVIVFVLASILGIFMIDQVGLVVGGTVLVLLASLAIGERRLFTLAGMGLGAVLVLLLVEWSGL